MDFTAELKRKTDIANEWINKLAPCGDGYHAKIFEVSNYSLSAGGKRIRPVISLAVCEMLGGKEEDVMPFACAIEFIHTYSLIHDDLPCMDDDDMRRGKPTCHKRYGEALALLAGDTLLNHAFETIANADASFEIKTEALKIISSASGSNGMIGGQVVDIKGAESYEELISLYKMKTGALIEAAAKIGVLAGGGDAQAYKSIADYTENLGIAFQIKDDLLDVEGDEVILGKSVGHDEATGKRTFVTSLGIDGAKIALKDYSENAKKSVGVFGADAGFLVWLADYLVMRNN